jgi:hypothetical protein
LFAITSCTNFTTHTSSTTCNKPITCCMHQLYEAKSFVACSNLFTLFCVLHL